MSEITSFTPVAPAQLPAIALPVLAKSDQNLIWLDREMTGLNPQKERIIEIAVIVTGPHLEPRIEGPVLVIHQSDELLGQMDNWNKGTHGRSGLKQWLLGSVAGKVVAQSTRPVLVVR